MIREIFLRDSLLWSCVWQSTIFIVIGLVGSFILRHRSARAHQVLFLAMMAAVIVPIMSILVKHYELGVFVAEPVVIQSRAEDWATTSDYRASGVILAEDIEHKPGPIEKDLLPAIAGSESAEFPWRLGVLYGWIMASLILAARLFVTFVLGVRLLGRALPLNCERIEEALHLARAKLGIDKDVKVRSSRSVRSPVIWCWRRRPVLLVPSDAGRFDNGVDWAGVLCHELAHWKRRDHISGLLAELVVCILPWHPLLWWAKSRLVRLSEQACDDWVVATGQPGTDYAESLLDLTPQGQMAFVPAVVRSRKGLAGRVRRILKDSCGNPRTGAIWALAVGIVAICITFGVSFAQTRPAKTEGTKDKSYFEGSFQLGKDINVELDAAPEGMRKIVHAKSIRFDKDDSDIKVTLRADVRKGLHFEWRTRIELLGVGGKVLDQRYTLNKSGNPVSGQPVIEELNIEFLPFKHNEVANARRFRISFEQAGPLLDELGRDYDANRTDWIQGHVTGPDGQPVVDAIVLINEHKPDGGPFRISRVGTDEKGYYMFGAVSWTYSLGAERRQHQTSTGIDCYQVLLLKRVFDGPQKIDFQFSEPPKGTASLVGHVVDIEGVPIREFTANISALANWKELEEVYSEESEDANGGYVKSTWFNQKVNSEDGVFRLENVPAGKYRIRIIPKEKQYEWHRQEVVLADGKTTNLALEVLSKHVLYGRVLFEDGSPAVIKPEPWPGAKTRILVPLGGRARGIATVEEDGYFAAYIDERELEQLKSTGSSLIINVPTTQQGRRKTVGRFPFELLSTEKSKAGVFKVSRPETKPLSVSDEASPEVDLRGTKQKKDNPSSEPDDGKAEEELWTALPARANNSASRTKLNKILDAMLYHDKSAMPIAMHVEIEMYNLDKPTDSQHYSTYSFEQRLDGLRLDSAMTVYSIEDGKRRRTQENRRVFTGNQFVYRQQSVDRPGRPLHASLKSVKEAKRIMAYYHLWGGVLLGYLRADQKPVAAILKDSLTVTLQDQMEVVRGFACQVIEGKTDHGSYKIWIDPEHNYRIRKSIVDKGPGDIYFGKPIPKNAPEDRWATATVHMEISDVKLERIGDHFIPTAETMTATRTATDGSKHRGQMVVKRSKIDLHPDFEKLGAFVMDGIPEGTRVTNSDPQSYGYEYEWRDGKVVPVGDGGTIFGRIELTGNVDLDTILEGKNQFRATISKMPATKDDAKEARQHRIELQVTEDGTFRIENVPAGRHLLHISLLKFSTVDLPSGGRGIGAREIGSVDHEFSIREKVEGAEYESTDLGVLKMATSGSIKPVDEVTNTAVGYRVRQSNKTKPKKTYRERVVHFPNDRSMGTLYIRDVGPDSWYESWQKLGEAMGDISIPAKKEVKLEINAETTGDLSSLAMLRADDLQMLSSGWKPIKIGSLAPIGSLKGLKALNLQRAKFNSEDFKYLTGLRQLEVLRLGDYNLTDSSMQYIGKLTSLRSLALWGTGISDEGLKHLQGLTNLTFLALNGCKITDEGLSYLKNMTALEGLQLTQTKITDEGLVKLKHLTRLKSLLIGHTKITDAGLEHLQGLTSLENIWITMNPITDEGLAYLSGMKNLKELYATGTKITDAGLLNLRGLKDFRHLIIDSIGDEGIAHLSELPALKLLQIQDAQVTEASIPDFKKMESIKEVLLSGDRVDDDLLDALRNPLPNCKIWDPQRSREYPMPTWRQRFEAVYRLEDGQILKRITPPFIPERKDYYVEEHSFQASAISRPPDSFYFHWVRKLKTWGLMFGTPSLDSTLRSVLRLKSYEYDGPKELLAMELLGDWIVRDEASQKEKLAALEQVLADELGRYIRFEKRTVEREVIVATGRFRFRPLPEVPSDNRVYMFSDIFDDRGGGGGTAESVPEFLLALGNHVGIPVIDQTQSPDEIRIPYNHHHSSYLRRVKDKTEKAEKLRMILDNLTKQTELQFEISLQPVEVWFVTEQNDSN